MAKKAPSAAWLNEHPAVVAARAHQVEIEEAKSAERREVEAKYPPLIAKCENRLAEVEAEEAAIAADIRSVFAAVVYGEPGADARRARALARREWLRLEREQYTCALEVIRADYQRDLARIRRFNGPSERADEAVEQAIAAATREFLASQPD